jgi:hypothetical protein
MEPIYPAPVFSVSLPSFLNEGTVWYSNGEGKLTQLSDFVWAEPLSKAIQRELALALAKEKPYPPNSRMEVFFARFILLDNGSAIAIADVQLNSADSHTVLPIVQVSIEEAWEPSNPSTYLNGYRELLKTTVTEILKNLPEPNPRSSNQQ